ncbi:MAG TPA: hypothetical protein VI796_04470 [Candidatus Thermoplasmatota archaeon]|nr:hypothetical protein [Candidatus Thermoplasmatota archaeon]
MPSVPLPFLLAAGALAGFGAGWLLQAWLDRRPAGAPSSRAFADRLADLEARVARLEAMLPPPAGTS